MRAAELVGPGALRIVDRDVAEPGPDEVLVKVGYSGICGSDLHLYRGDDPWRSSTPGVPAAMGHETSGAVAATGPGIDDLRVGERVSVEPAFLHACGSCSWCLAGRSQLCRGRGQWHGQAALEYEDEDGE